AGEDMLLICSTPETIRRGYQALLKAAREDEIPRKRIQGSLKRIAEIKTLAQPPLKLDMKRYDELAAQIQRVNDTLDYHYPGESHRDETREKNAALEIAANIRGGCDFDRATAGMSPS